MSDESPAPTDLPESDLPEPGFMQVASGQPVPHPPVEQAPVIGGLAGVIIAACKEALREHRGLAPGAPVSFQGLDEEETLVVREAANQARWGEAEEVPPNPNMPPPPEEDRPVMTGQVDAPEWTQAVSGNGGHGG